MNGGTLQLVTSGYAAGTGPIFLNGGTLYLNGVGTGTTISCAGTNTLQTCRPALRDFQPARFRCAELQRRRRRGIFADGDWSGFSGTLNLNGNWVRELNSSTFGSSNAVWNFGPSCGLYNKYGGATISLGALFGGTASVLGGATTAYATLTTFVVGGINTNSVFNGTIYDGAAAASAIIFNGPGSLTLTGNNSFSGNTTVNGGTFYVNNTVGSGTGSGTSPSISGATLGGNGAIGGQLFPSPPAAFSRPAAAVPAR